MKDFGRRLDKLEQAIHGGGCPVCQEWPPSCVVHTNGDSIVPPNVREQLARWDGPDKCPKCGWEPLTVQITYVDDWPGGLPTKGRLTLLPDSDEPPHPDSLMGRFGG